MPTRHPRIAVTRDDELDRVLRATEPLLSADETDSAAAQVRALALRGAQALGAGAASAGDQDLWARLQRDHGVRPPGDRTRIEGPTGEVDPGDPTPASDALDWVRGER